MTATRPPDFALRQRSLTEAVLEAADALGTDRVLAALQDMASRPVQKPPTRVELEAAASTAIREHVFDLDNFLGDATSTFQRLIWEPWSCTDDECPSRPAVDLVIDSEIYAEAVRSLERRVLRLVERWLVDRATSIAERFPEASRAVPEGEDR